MQIFCFYQCHKSTSALAQHQSTYIQRRNSFSSFLLSVKGGKREIFCARRISEGSEVFGKMLATLTLLNLAAMVLWFFVSPFILIENFISFRHWLWVSPKAECSSEWRIYEPRRDALGTSKWFAHNLIIHLGHTELLCHTLLGWCLCWLHDQYGNTIITIKYLNQ